MGFTRIKDLNKSPAFDISARFELQDAWQKEEIAEKIFEKCQEKVQSIQIKIKN